jgi:GT2 family glycosyltransferase
MPEFGVILVNYKRPADTIECLQSLREGTFRDYHAWVVDNDSGDGSVDMIRAAAPEATVVANTENSGFCEGNNIGLRLARAAGVRLLILLNNDTVAAPDALERLADAFARRPTMGLCGPKITYHDRKNVIWFAGGSVSLVTGRPTHRGIGRLDGAGYDHEAPCGFITGCALTFRTEVYDRIGGLDPDFFAYFEDADFSVRTARAGFGVWYIPSAVIAHKVSSTAGWDSPVYLYFTLRNRLLFLRKNAPAGARLAGLPALAILFLRQFTRLLLKWRNVPGARAAWFALIDGLSSSPAATGRGRLNDLTRTI